MLQSFVLADPNPSTAATVHFAVTFSEAVTGLAATNFILAGSAAPGTTIGTPTTSDGGITWTVSVTAASGGTLGLTLNNRTAIHDGDGNKLYNTTSDDGSVFTPIAGPLYTIQLATTTSIGAGLIDLREFRHVHSHSHQHQRHRRRAGRQRRVLRRCDGLGRRFATERQRDDRDIHVYHHDTRRGSS